MKLKKNVNIYKYLLLLLTLQESHNFVYFCQQAIFMYHKLLIQKHFIMKNLIIALANLFNFKFEKIIIDRKSNTDRLNQLIKDEVLTLRDKNQNCKVLKTVYLSWDGYLTKVKKGQEIRTRVIGNFMFFEWSIEKVIYQNDKNGTFVNDIFCIETAC